MSGYEGFTTEPAGHPEATRSEASPERDSAGRERLLSKHEAPTQPFSESKDPYSTTALTTQVDGSDGYGIMPYNETFQRDRLETAPKSSSASFSRLSPLQVSVGTTTTELSFQFVSFLPSSYSSTVHDVSRKTRKTVGGKKWCSRVPEPAMRFVQNCQDAAE
jgi:hypothetical protein